MMKSEQPPELGGTPIPHPTDALAPKAMTKRAGKFIPDTLVALLSAPDANVREFVKRAAKKPSSKVEVDAAIEADVPAEDALERALELARELRKVGRRTPPLVDCCTRLLSKHFPDLGDWRGGRDGAEALRALAAATGSARDGKQTRKIADTGLALGVNLLLLERALDGLAALRTLWPFAQAELDFGNRTPSQRLVDLLGQAGAKSIRDLSLVAGLLEDRVERAETAATQAVRESQELSRERDELRAELARVRSESAKLRAQLEEGARREADLAVRLTEAETRVAHTSNTLKARTRRVLGERIGGLLSDADEAMAIEPPEVEVTRERIDMARAEIKKELEWLTTSGA